MVDGVYGQHGVVVHDLVELVSDTDNVCVITQSKSNINKNVYVLFLMLYSALDLKYYFAFFYNQLHCVLSLYVCNGLASECRLA